MANPNVILTALWLCLQLGVSQVAFAQGAYPSRAITIINPFPPGGTSEIVTRPLAAALEPVVKQPVILETKSGAAGAVGAQFVATATPDGYTLLSHITSLSGFAEVDKLFGRKPKFTRVDFVPIARFTADPMVVVVNQQQPYKTLNEFIADAKNRPHGSSSVHPDFMGRRTYRWRYSPRLPVAWNCDTCRLWGAVPR